VYLKKAKIAKNENKDDARKNVIEIYLYDLIDMYKHFSRHKANAYDLNIY